MTKPNVRVEGLRKSGTEHSIVDLALMRDYVNIVHPTASYDYMLTFSVPGAPPRNRTVCPYMEPPIGQGYYDPYENPMQFHTVYGFNPQRKQFPITEDAVVFPYAPHTDWDRKRKLHKGRGIIYYAGNRVSPHQTEPDRFSRHNLYGLRTRIVEDLMRRGAKVIAYGPGWPRGSTRTQGDFQANKAREIEACNADFVLCLENSSLRNYISEKLHNGFQSGRVVCYLGEPLIHKRIPEAAFINLNDLCNFKTKEFDHETLYLLLNDMTQAEYKNYAEAADDWRNSGLDERRTTQSHRLTMHILKRIGCL